MEEKRVEIVIEAFGNKNLKKFFSADELRGKSVDQIVYDVIQQTPNDSNAMNLQMIKSQINASDGYTPKIYDKRTDQPVKFMPVNRNSKVLEYVRDNQVVINVTGDHKVGDNYIGNYRI